MVKRSDRNENELSIPQLLEKGRELREGKDFSIKSYPKGLRYASATPSSASGQRH